MRREEGSRMRKIEGRWKKKEVSSWVLENQSRIGKDERVYEREEGVEISSTTHLNRWLPSLKRVEQWSETVLKSEEATRLQDASSSHYQNRYQNESTSGEAWRWWGRWLPLITSYDGLPTPSHLSGRVSSGSTPCKERTRLWNLGVQPSNSTNAWPCTSKERLREQKNRKTEIQSK